METNITWEQKTRAKFDQLIERVPIFMREVAREKVSRRAEEIIRKEGRSTIEEKDMVDALFAETPFGFHGPMKNDLKELGIDYTRYGYES